MRGTTRLTRRGSIPGRAARGSISPRKATCQVPASGSSSFGPRSPARAIRKWERPGCREYPTSATHRKAPRRLHRRGLSVVPGRFWMGREGSPSTKDSQNHLVPPQAERPRCRRNPGPPAPGLSRLVLAEPTASERIHRSLSRCRKAVHWVTAVTEGKIDRPYPGLTMVLESAEQRVQSSSHGLQYGQDWPCRYFSNDFNLTARMTYPPRAS